MTIEVGVNSYVTVDEATAYFASRFGYYKWPAETEKEAALISAAQILDVRCAWYGQKIDIEQKLAFPRTGANPTPSQIKDAQCEIAYEIVETGSTKTDGGDALSKLKAGSVELSFKATAGASPIISELTSSLLSPYGLCSGGGGTRLVPIQRG